MKRHFRKIHFVLIPIIILTSSCTFDNLEDLREQTGQCPLVTPTYSGVIKNIIKLNCSDPDFGSCHQSGSLNGDFTNYSGLKEKATDGSLEHRALIIKTMPPSSTLGPPTLSLCDKQSLRIWLDEGALDN